MDKKTKSTIPIPLFDTRDHVKKLSIDSSFPYQAEHHDFKYAQAFLKSYDGSEATFNAYRREVERLLQWSWLVAKKPIRQLRRSDIESYLAFCQAPPVSWIGTKKAPRFIEKGGQRVPNPAWRPFVVTLSKAAVRKGELPSRKNYLISQSAVREIFAILSSFYNFLIQEEYTEVNPILHIRQKSKFIRKRQGKPIIRRLTEIQWQYVIATSEQLAKENPHYHERTLFMMNALYAMYLRISELAASSRWTPKMGDFRRDHDGCWWFTTVGKGNKERQIAVSDAMLSALKRYRNHLGLSPLPAPSDTTPLIPKVKGKGAVCNISHIRKIIQLCFDKATELLKKDGHKEDADSLNAATVHWLRHTGISEDVKHRPREHVRDDAGHSSSATTDKYIDIELRERHRTARRKPIRTARNQYSEEG